MEESKRDKERERKKRKQKKVLEHILKRERERERMNEFDQEIVKLNQDKRFFQSDKKYLMLYIQIETE